MFREFGRTPYFLFGGVTMSYYDFLKKQIDTNAEEDYKIQAEKRVVLLDECSALLTDLREICPRGNFNAKHAFSVGSNGNILHLDWGYVSIEETSTKSDDMSVVIRLNGMRRGALRVTPKKVFFSNQDGRKLSYTALAYIVRDKEKIIKYIESANSYFGLRLGRSNIKQAMDINARFEQLYHNTGLKLRDVITKLSSEGYRKSEIMSAIVSVLGNIEWQD